MRTTPTQELTLRSARPDDAEALGQICYEAFCGISGMHNFPPDFPSPEITVGFMHLLVDRAHTYSVVAEQDGRPVGSSFLWDGHVMGVGPVTVDPQCQGESVGKLMMQAILKRADEVGASSVRLVQAAFNTRSMCLYTKLGFEVREPLACINGIPLRKAIRGYDVRSAGLDDVQSMNALCKSVHGHQRESELHPAISKGTALVVERDGALAGYTTELGFFGHMVAIDNNALIALIAAAPSIGGPGFLLPTRNSEVFRWVLANGFRMIQPLTLMSRGWYQEPRGAFLPSILF